MRKFLFLSLLFISAALSAQNVKVRMDGADSFRDKYMLESNYSLVSGQHGVTLQMENTNLFDMYLTKNKSLYMSVGNVMRFAYNHRVNKGFIVPICVAGGFGYSLVNDVEYNSDTTIKKRMTLDFLAMCKQTVFGCFNWKYTELDLGFKVHGNKMKKNDFILGIGYKYTKSHSKDVGDMNGWYISMGSSL